MNIQRTEIGKVGNIKGLIAKIVLSSAKAPSKRMCKHWTFMIDASGSMSDVINQVKRDMRGFVNELPDSDLASIIVYSGHGEARLLAGPIVTANGDGKGKAALLKVIDSIHIMSNTVFSEALDLVGSHVDNMKAEKADHEVILLTDGCPVPNRWSEAQEIALSLTGAKKLAGRANVSTIGYNNYYNPGFLSSLVEVNGNNGIRRHINDVASFASVIKDIRTMSERRAYVDIEFALTSGGKKGGLVLRTTPEITRIGDHGEFHIHSMDNGEVTLFVSFPEGGDQSIRFVGTDNGKAIDTVIKASELSLESKMEAMIAAASWAFQTQDSVTAADLLQQTNNPTLAAMIGSAYSMREKLVLADEMRRILVDNNVRQRYSTRNYIGKGESPCIVNLLRTLLEEDCTVFIPKGTYTRTTLTVIEKGTRHKPNAKIKMIDIQSNEDRYNVSMKTAVDAERQDEATQKWEDHTIFRNYVVIKDGSLHQDTLEAYLTKKAFDQCLAWGVIPPNSKFSDTYLFTIDLTVLPMILSAWANPKQLGLVDLMKEELVLKVQQTAINKRVKELRSEATEYPEREVQGDAIDTYVAPAFKYELKGFVPADVNYNHITKFEEAEKLAKKIRKRLLVVRCLKRLILFALDMTGNKLFANVQATEAKRTKPQKMEQLIVLADFGEPNLTLRRLTWNEVVEVTASTEGTLAQAA